MAGSTTASSVATDRPVSRAGIVHFQLSGEGLTRIARDLYATHGVTRAVRFLSEGLEGLTAGQAIEVIAGLHRFDGDASGMRLVPEDATVREALKQAAEATWSLRWQDERGAWWEPYALVSSWAQEDADFAREHWSTRGNNTTMYWRTVDEQTPTRCSAVRTLYYADTPTEDIATWQEVPRGMVLSRPVPEPDLVTFATLGWSAVFNRSPRAAPYPPRGPTFAPADTMPQTVPLHQGQVRALPSPPSEDSDNAWALARAREVHEQAERVGGWILLQVDRPVGDTRPTSYRIPRAPLERHVRRDPLSNLAEPGVWSGWSPVHPSGLRLFGDSPDHSDWMGGSLPPIPPFYDNGTMGEYDRPLASAIWSLRGRIYGRWQDSQHVEHLAGPRVRTGFTGRAVHAQPDTTVPPGSVVIAPHAGVAYYMAAHSAGPTGLVIVEAGGAMAHLTVQAAEDGFSVLLAPDALTYYPEGTLLQVSYDSAGRPNIHVIEEAT